MNNVLSTDVIFVNSTSSNLEEFLQNKINSTKTSSYNYKNIFDLSYLTVKSEDTEYYINVHGISSGIENFLLPAKIMNSSLVFLVFNIDSYGTTATQYSNYINTPEKLNTIVEWALEHLKKYNPERKVVISLMHYNYSQIKNNFKNFKQDYEEKYREKFGDMVYDIIWDFSQPTYYTPSYGINSLENCSEKSNLVKIEKTLLNFIKDYPNLTIQFTDSDLNIITALFTDEVFSKTSVLTKESIFGLFERMGINDHNQKEKFIQKLASSGFLFGFKTKNFKDIYIKMDTTDENNFINILIKIYKVFGSRYDRKDKKAKTSSGGYAATYNTSDSYVYSVVKYNQIMSTIPKKFFKRIKIINRMFLNLFKDLHLVRHVDKNTIFFRRYDASSVLKGQYKIFR